MNIDCMERCDKSIWWIASLTFINSNLSALNLKKRLEIFCLAFSCVKNDNLVI